MERPRVASWLFPLCFVLILAFAPDIILGESLGKTTGVSKICEVIAGLVGNIAATYFVDWSKERSGKVYNSYLVGICIGLTLYVIFNVIGAIVGNILLSFEIAIGFDTSNGRDKAFDLLNLLSYSTIALIATYALATCFGAFLLNNARSIGTAVMVTTLVFVGLGLTVRLTSESDAAHQQFEIFAGLGWWNIAEGVLADAAILSMLLWMGAYLRQIRRVWLWQRLS
ncbi:MAG TPA: hypothetical protein VNT30_05255 [Stellaceae bacterium]|nr:hypothetical protein [Stellaceae bacterium]